ncbi:hypothetical protein BTO21_08270 [Photobacterium phosphoreum]|nr:hypothetical protein UB41_19685 [Photobacterium phosphoreum]PQJ91693.1 hypothetical protein BTO21_08270 [Photobacterium phosphoreum]PSV66035.1 hypothetical protein CTM77_20240 [Photobacterium phosphoreum]
MEARGKSRDKEEQSCSKVWRRGGKQGRGRAELKMVSFEIFSVETRHLTIGNDGGWGLNLKETSESSNPTTDPVPKSV